MPDVLWTPDQERVSRTRLSSFAAWLAKEGVVVDIAGYDTLRRWSVSNLDAFWSAIWTFFGVDGERGEQVLADQKMPGARWFPGSRLNYAEHLLRNFDDDETALVWRDEVSNRRSFSAGDLRTMSAALADTLLANGVGPRDVVAGFLPNVPEALIAFIACASIGAIWTNCSPEYGAASVLDRLQQVRPKGLVYADGYRYQGTLIDKRQTVQELLDGLPTLQVLVHVPYPRPCGGAHAHLEWSSATSGAAVWNPVRLDFSHPLWIVYSSGTSGPPKALVHSHGGILLEHLKSHGLHLDLDHQDIFFWYTSTGWIMWYLQVAGLLFGAQIVLYEGSPTYPSLSALWGLVEEESITHFGLSASLIETQMRCGLDIAHQSSLGSLRMLGSTGSPLSAGGFTWAYNSVKSDLWLMAFSGGTDVATALVGGNPNLPVIAGEMQCRWLGAAVEAWDTSGSATDSIGELVITRPMPSMPLMLVGDPDGERYRDSYFEKYSHVWQHGDLLELTSSGGAIIHGRSDSTLNRRGIRIGTGEIYNSLSKVSYLKDSLALEVRTSRDSEMVLFVVLHEGHQLDDEKARSIRLHLRDTLTPRHLPDRIVQVSDIPRTLNGKKMEVPTKRLFGGAPAGEVFSFGAMSNPECVEEYVALARGWLTNGSL